MHTFNVQCILRHAVLRKAADIINTHCAGWQQVAAAGKEV